ncbi:hypothetical protein ETD83_02505 [Actinomadura soli]|uniref:Uncharacterized protein n=1 Tax=Actinomadura soli TaxID=2508997 RepID=A0A5C4JJA9_9ACTN|nr:hypothetical protein [Actinomadura soli]TMR06911.1 hypothetical protein ETD83_02505 [Actinomadura soli]
MGTVSESASTARARSRLCSRTEIQFWAQVLTDAERTICCSHENESRIKCWIAARGLSGRYKVIATPVVPDSELIVVDERAIDAAMSEALHREQREAELRQAAARAARARHVFGAQLIAPRARNPHHRPLTHRLPPAIEGSELTEPAATIPTSPAEELAQRARDRHLRLGHPSSSSRLP